MSKWLRNILYSFPVQLVLLHIRNHLLLTAIWILLGTIISGTLAAKFGMKYLFWSPEYLGEVNFWSFFFLGVCFASFSMTWNLTTYILSAHNFPFLASLARPFTKFCINNFLFPLFFLLMIVYFHVRFQVQEEIFSWEDTFYNVLGFLFGLLSLVALLLSYFISTNKNVLSYTPQNLQEPPHLVGTVSPRRPVDIEKIRSEVVTWRVDTYLTESFRPRPVRSVSHYSLQTLMSVFKQNHTNALIVQLISLIILILLGVLIEKPSFRIPAAASLLLFLSIVVSLIGAVLYWFQYWSVTIFILLFLSVNFLTKQGFFNHKNLAYGLAYEAPRPAYNYDSLCAVFSKEKVELDKQNTISILENWKANVGKARPKMVFVCVSGGGFKAATWSMKVLQTIDSLTQGQLMKQTVLMSGASGGMMGMAYFRELYWQQQQGQAINIYDEQHIYDISKDLLNPIAFTIVTNDLFLPKGHFGQGTKKYPKDRGYIFEQQFNENTHQRLNKPIAAYQAAEERADLPLLFITPYIVNDARRLIISPHPVSYMTHTPLLNNYADYIDIDAVDFQTFFKHQEPDSLRFTSALRMNATFPYILPTVTLPTSPDIEIMDAGFRDNFGLKSAIRFSLVFKDWIKQHTSGVAFLVIRGIDKRGRAIEATDNDGIIQSLIDPLGIAGQFMLLQDYEHDTQLGFLNEVLGEDFFELAILTYRPSTRNEEASMTFHLTPKERIDILEAIHLEDNQKAIQRMHNLLTQ